MGTSFPENVPEHGYALPEMTQWVETSQPANSQQTPHYQNKNDSDKESSSVDGT
jgi:hypothetical protein